MLVNNRPDVLARIAATLSARGFNIESISANATRDPALTKIVITALATPETIGRIVKHLDRLVDVLDVRRVRRGKAIWRELVLARVPLGGARRRPWRSSSAAGAARWSPGMPPTGGGVHRRSGRDRRDLAGAGDPGRGGAHPLRRRRPPLRGASLAYPTRGPCPVHPGKDAFPQEARASAGGHPRSTRLRPACLAR